MLLGIIIFFSIGRNNFLFLTREEIDKKTVQILLFPLGIIFIMYNWYRTLK